MRNATPYAKGQEVVINKIIRHNKLRTTVLYVGVLAVIFLITLMLLPPFANLLGGQTSMLSVHLLMELFAVIIAMLIVMVSWHTFDTADVRSGSFIICGFLIVASCDLMHALTYRGMPALFAESSTPRAIFFWLMGRTFEVTTLALIALKYSPALSKWLWLGLGVVTSGVIVWIGSFHIDVFPVTFVQDQGVTEFKATYEYALCILNVAVAAMFWVRAERTGLSLDYLLSLSSFVMGIGEIAFTSYVAPSDVQNIFGHSYKIAAYSLLYWATFATSIRAPFDALRQSEGKLRDSERRLLDILNRSPIAVRIAVKQGGEVVFFNPRYADLIKNHDSTGDDPKGYYSRPEDYEAVMADLTLGHSVINRQTELRLPDGSTIWTLASYMPIQYQDDDAVLGWFYDISELMTAEEEIKHLAFFDQLTHLPNRQLLMDRLQHAFATSGRSGRQGALLFIDIDHFKTLNDSLGHHVGDLLLQQVATRFESCVRECDTVSRLGGDEFVVLLEELSEQPLEAATQAEAVGEKIFAALSQPFQLEKIVFRCTASIGVTLFSGNKQARDELMKQADIAMYEAKKAGRNTMCFFDRQMQEVINNYVALEGEMHHALEKQQFHLYYQIQVDSSNHSIGAEALIRWIHPERGSISPAQFIPLSEETGLILPIGQWVLETACAQLKNWENSALTNNLVLSVNVSARQFRQADFVDQVQSAVRRHAINPTLLKLELTEGMLLQNIADTIATMKVLKDFGVQFSLDDFGTGYSSLQYLKRLPLDQLKIDQSFVRDLAVDSSDKAIVRTITAMAQSLNLEVIAEGVETEEQRLFLLSIGCTQFQGYLFGKPAPIGQFEALLRQD